MPSSSRVGEMFDPLDIGKIRRLSPALTQIPAAKYEILKISQCTRVILRQMVSIKCQTCMDSIKSEMGEAAFCSVDRIPVKATVVPKELLISPLFR